MDGLKTIFQNITSGRKTMTFTDSAITNNSVIEVYPDSSLDIIPVGISINGHSCTVTFDKNASATKSVCMLINNIVGEFLPGGSTDIEVTAYYETGDHIADITVDDETTEIYAPGSSFSGDAYDIDWKDFGEEIGVISVGDGMDIILDELEFQGEYIEEKIPPTLIDGSVLVFEDSANTWRKLDASDIIYNNDNTVHDMISNLEDLVPDDATPGTYLYHATTGNYWRKPTASNIDYDDNSTIYSIIGDIDEITTTSKNLVGAINEIKSSGGGMSYDTSEHVIGSWIDGTPIYERTFYLTEFSGQLWQSNQWYEVTSIDSTNIKLPISAELIWLETGYDGETHTNAVNYMVSVSNNSSAFHDHIAILFYRPNTAMNNIYLTLRYLKKVV